MERARIERDERTGVAGVLTRIHLIGRRWYGQA